MKKYIFIVLCLLIFKLAFAGEPVTWRHQYVKVTKAGSEKWIFINTNMITTLECVESGKNWHLHILGDPNTYEADEYLYGDLLKLTLIRNP